MTTKKMPTVTVELDEVKKLVQAHTALMQDLQFFVQSCACCTPKDRKQLDVALAALLKQVDNAFA
jgi:hypothetical protein